MLTGPAPELVQGCCSYGAHLVDKKDARRVEKAAATLTPEEWQNHGKKKTVIEVNKHGETVTKLVGDACIFLNKPDFPAGAGCAFHIAAARRGVNFMTLKPEVCWQLPLRREDQVDDEDGHVTSVVRQWDRRHWGKGGREFHWWCTEEPDAFVGTKPVYEEMEDELTEMVGRQGLRRDGLAPRRAGPAASAGVPLPHPAVRQRADGDRPRRRPSAVWSWRFGAVACQAQLPDLSDSALRSVVERVVVRAGRGRDGTQDAVVLVLFGHAPRRVHVVGLGTALDALAGRFCGRSLQASRFFEAPMASFFHENSLSHPVRANAARPTARALRARPTVWTV